MEEFRRAHRRMFGENDSSSEKSIKSSKSETNTEKEETKESVKETKSLPIGGTPTPPVLKVSPIVKTPPTVPLKKVSTGPVVQIGTYGSNNFTNNRFVSQTQTHKSVIQVRRQDSNDSTGSSTVNEKDSQITIKVISTKPVAQ